METVDTGGIVSDDIPVLAEEICLLFTNSISCINTDTITRAVVAVDDAVVITSVMNISPLPPHHFERTNDLP